MAKSSGKKIGRDSGKERAWRRWIDEQRLGGESVRAFCRGRDLNESSFYYWRREIALRDGETVGTRKTMATLAPVVMIEELAGVAAIEIVLRDATTVRVPSGATREQLSVVLDALESSRC
jgi:transposase-like protein